MLNVLLATFLPYFHETEFFKESVAKLAASEAQEPLVFYSLGSVITES